MSMNESYSEYLVQFARVRIRRAGSRGFWVPSSVPYGYRKITEGEVGRRHPLQALHEDNVLMVKRIFNMAKVGGRRWSERT